MANASDFDQFHWMVEMVQNIDMGLIVIDRDYKIQLWNGFMVHHSGMQAKQVMGKSLFDVFTDVPQDWFRAKARPVFELGCRSFVVWQQRPYLFHCRNVRPITDRAKHMYQNITLNPMANTRGEIGHIFISIKDVTAEALSKLDERK